MLAGEVSPRAAARTLGVAPSHAQTGSSGRGDGPDSQTRTIPVEGDSEPNGVGGNVVLKVTLEGQ